MCGIAGIANYKNGFEKQEISSMINAIRHRGPDEMGFHFFSSCALGHTRLSIVDLSSGQQPMLSLDGTKGLVFNGEIYGYKPIREKLSYPFRTKSDTEVLIALYEKYGENMLEHLPGMFAFALWNDEKKRLFCARDRFGEKPFFYAIGKNGEFLFASEIKAIIASGLIEPIISKKALKHYLQFLYIDPKNTAFTNIFSLPPAHSLSFADGKIEVKRYWSLPDGREISLESAKEQFVDLFEKAVSSQLIADVPVGAFLSGGLDSSTIVAAACKITKNINTFSFAFRDSFNELPFARQVSKKYQTKHTELYDDQEDLADLMLKMAEIYDEPFADSSCIPTYLISREAAKHIKVVLTGDGGDELLGGYPAYKSIVAMQDSSNNIALRFFYNFAAKSARLFTLSRNNLDVRAAGFNLKSKFSKTADAYMHLRSYFKPEDLIKFDFLTNDAAIELTESGTVEDALRYDILQYMPGDILVKTDRASMAHGLELRAPFLDVDLASFCISLPYQLKLDKNRDKIILREIFEIEWPSSLMNRPKKGFGAPVEKWLTQPRMLELLESFLRDTDRRIFSIIQPQDLSPYFFNKDYKTWILLVLSIWLEKNPYRIE